MNSQTNEVLNSNTNPQAVIDVNINIELMTSMDENLSEGWGNWSLEDMVRIICSTNWELYLASAGYIGKIIFLKLLEAANNQNIPF